MTVRPRRTDTALVIPTTHWDRDWYWPFERFRVKLIELFQTVKQLWREHPDYRFAIDGQTIPVDDYLEALPGERALLERMGAAGRFTMGPLYVQSDLYCTGGEALIRNLLIGTSTAVRFNALQRVVYLPDTFGHTPCMPMLVSGFGFSTYVLMRGLPQGFPSDKRFFRWRSPDGSVVNVFRLRDGYANAARLGLHHGTGEVFDKKSSGIRPAFKMEMAVEQLGAAVRRQIDGQGSPYVLLAGVDHQIPQLELPAIMRRCCSGGLSMRFADWNEVERAMLRRPTRGRFEYEGEFHGIGASSVLGGTVSTRIYLKQANAEAERALGCVAEPADAVVKLLGIDEPAGEAITAAWKRLLKAHPHDDITGCSVDTVHRENEMHITCANQAADAIRRRMAHDLIQHFGGQAPGDSRYAFFAYSTQGATSRPRVLLKADYEGRLNWGDTRPFRCYALVDEDGRRVPFREVERRRSIEHPHPVLDLELRPELRPFTFQRFFVEERSRWPKTIVKNTLENERLRVVLRHDGTVDIHDKRTGRTWAGIGFFSDQADCGDEYTFSHIKRDIEETFTGTRMRRTEAFGCNGLQVAGFAGELRVPQESSPAGRSRRRVRLPVTIEYSLAPGDTALTCKVAFVNTAFDHRLRWNLALPFTPRVTRAGLKFGEVERPASKPVRTGEGYLIHPEHPADEFVAVGDRSSGIAVFPPFPVNYELVRGPQPRLSIAVLRAVGFLSRNDMLTRGGGAGPDTLTPDAQCRRGMSMVFAVRPYETRTESQGLLAEALRRRWAPVTGLIMGFDPDRRDIPQGPLLETDGDGVMVSALKRSHDGRGVIVRLFNACGQARDARIVFDRPRSVSDVGLDEGLVRRARRRKRRARSVGITMPPWSLRTLAVE